MRTCHQEHELPQATQPILFNLEGPRKLGLKSKIRKRRRQREPSTMIHLRLTHSLFLYQHAKPWCGFWDKGDYDVRLGDGSGPVVGRIRRHPQTSRGFRRITERREQPTLGVIHLSGYAAISREQARCDILLQGRLRCEARCGSGR